MPRPTPLKLIIVHKGLIQADIAQDLNISESRLSRIVNGRSKPHEYELKTLASHLGLKKEDLV